MRLYFIGVIAVLLFVGLKGFILPLLFSAKSDEALFLGVVILVIAPVLFWLLWRIAKREMQREKK